MHPRKSRLSARPAERPILAPHWLTTLLAILVGGALWLLYPRQDLERRLSETEERSALATAYIANLLRSDPDNPRLKALLQEREAREQAVKEAAKNALNDAADPLWLQLDQAFTKYRAQSSLDSEQKAALAAEVTLLIRQLASRDLSDAQLLRLAQMALETTEPSLGLDLFEQIAQSQNSTNNKAKVYAQAAQNALGVSQYRLSADWYIKARQTSTDPAQAKNYYLSAVAALQSGNQPKAALQLAQEQLPPLQDDPEVLHMLVQLARAAGQPDVAARYMRILLRIALAQQLAADMLAQWELPQHNDEAHPTLTPMAWASTPETLQGLRWQVADTYGGTPHKEKARTSQEGPRLPFDNKTYTLGYEVFLESKNLDDAWLVARAAVRQAPGDMAWRERLAQVSEWTQRSEVALENWLMVARSTQKDEAWQAVLRLAPGLFDDEALQDGLLYSLRKTPDDLRLIKALIDTSERLGTPQVALKFLQQNDKHPALLEMHARLAQRAGEPQLALQSWDKLLSQPGQNTPERALEAAVLALLQGNAEQGLAWLENAQAPDPRRNSDPASEEYWRLTAQLAESQQRQKLAIDAYRSLIASRKAEIGDYDGLIRMLQADHPMQAAEIGIKAWEQHRQPRHLVLALNFYASRNQWQAIAPLLQKVQAMSGDGDKSVQELLENPEFLRLAGLYHQNGGRPALARKHFETGLQLAPTSASMRQALLWLYIDGNDNIALREVLARHEAVWSQDEEMHDALASAYQALSQPQVALQRYLQPRLAAHQHDFLWLMNYTDALDQNQQSDRAWRMRRYLLSNEWQRARATHTGKHPDRSAARTQWLSEEGLDATRRIARTRLLLTQRPGDPALEALRELLRLDRDANKNFSNAAAETAIGWLQDAGEYNAERGFLWQQYARSLSLRSNRPLWADITVALAERDNASTGQLLEAFDERLPRYDRVNAARAVGDTHLAQSAAFETQEQQPHDDPLHLQLTENLLAVSDQVGLEVVRRVLDGITEVDKGARLQLALSSRLSLELRVDHVQRMVNRADQVRNPSSEQGLNIALRWRGPRSSAALRLGHRESLRSYNPVHWEYEYQWFPSLALRMDAGWQLPTQESLALRMGGMKDRASLGLRLQPTPRDQFVLEQWYERYHLQTGANVGSGNHTALTYNHAYRLGSPSLDIGAFWSRHSYSRRDPATLGGADRDFARYLPDPNAQVGPDFFLPQNFQFYGLQLQSNMRYERDYTRALQPFASVARTWHSEQGPGYNLQLGMAGSVLGADHLSIKAGLAKSGSVTRGLTREIHILYRIYD